MCNVVQAFSKVVARWGHRAWSAYAEHGRRSVLNRLWAKGAVLMFDGGRPAIIAGGGTGAAAFLGHGVDREALGDGVKKVTEAV